MADLATEAGVSVPLLYKVFGTKPQLVKRVYDVLLAGDVDPVPVAERPALQALVADPDPRGKLARYATLGRAMSERARDLIWLHTAPDTYRLLVLERGWALDEYERWLATSLAAALLPAPAPPTSS